MNIPPKLTTYIGTGGGVLAYVSSWFETVNSTLGTIGLLLGIATAAAALCFKIRGERREMAESYARIKEHEAAIEAQKALALVSAAKAERDRAEANKISVDDEVTARVLQQISEEAKAYRKEHGEA